MIESLIGQISILMHTMENTCYKVIHVIFVIINQSLMLVFEQFDARKVFFYTQDSNYIMRV